MAPLQDASGVPDPVPPRYKEHETRLDDEDRVTLVRWIDLGCPIELDFDAEQPEVRGHGWLADNQRPTLALTEPRAGANGPPPRVLLGMHDYGTGLDPESSTVVADFAVDGAAAGENLAKKFEALPENRWELRPAEPIGELPKGKLTVSIKDRQGNITRVERTFSGVR